MNTRKVTAATTLAELASFVEDSPEAIERARSQRTSRYADNPFRDVVSNAYQNGTKRIRVTGDRAAEVVRYLRNAADSQNVSIRIRQTDDALLFEVGDRRAYSKRGSAGKAECPECGAEAAITAASTLRTHGPRSNRCPGSGAEVVD